MGSIKRKYMKKIAQMVVVLGSVMALLAPTVALAAEFINPKDDSGNVVLSTTETHSNAYVAGGTVTMNSTIKGDMFAVGGTVSMDGAVEGDLVVAGGTVTINNTVGGDVRVAGGTVTINSQVAGDVLVAGGTVVLSEKGKVGGDLATAGGTVTVSAPVGGKLWVAGGNVTIDSQVAGAVVVRGAKQVVFGPHANIASSISVKAEGEPKVLDGAKVSTIDFEKTNYGGVTRGVYARSIALGILISIFATLIVALTLVWLAPKRIAGFVYHVKSKFWVNAGLGFVFLVVVPIVAIVLLVLVVGYALAFLLFAFYLLALALSWVLTVLWIGAWASSLVNKQPGLAVGWKTATLGAVVVAVIKFIPVVGALFCFVVMLAVLGGLVTSIKSDLVEHGEVKE